VGLVTIQAAQALGARVISVEPSNTRRAFARKMGAALVLNPQETDIREEVLRQTDGIGVDAAFDCVGQAQMMKSAIELTRKGGRIIAVGFTDDALPVTINRLITAKQSIIGSLGYGDEFPQTIKMLEETEGSARELITARIPLDEIIEKGYNELSLLQNPP
jgi:(R,R)-butanediol dehydrogenase/meso-butanediol dehydrogenase/diacetyl reductase